MQQTTAALGLLTCSRQESGFLESIVTGDETKPRPKQFKVHPSQKSQESGFLESIVTGDETKPRPKQFKVHPSQKRLWQLCPAICKAFCS
ncbi:hypothetical protein QE152_g24635 [Popillia japonica]|uniref:Uncharacterized protein n=1 Tax=Popillia japonica TaxID=7064 RepID=A0AAW1K6V9_POPJA